MSTTGMHRTNQQPAVAWAMPRQAAVTLAAEQAQVVWVHEGRVWLTREVSQDTPEDDVWLCAGQRHVLPAGSRWVAEAWPFANVSVVQAPRPAKPRGVAAALRAWWSSRPRLSNAARALGHAL